MFISVRGQDVDIFGSHYSAYCKREGSKAGVDNEQVSVTEGFCQHLIGSSVISRCSFAHHTVVFQLAQFLGE